MPEIKRTLPLLKKGEPGTLLDTDKANELISLVNKIANLRVILDPSVAPSESRLDVSESDAVIIVGTKQG